MDICLTVYDRIIREKLYVHNVHVHANRLHVCVCICVSHANVCVCVFNVHAFVHNILFSLTRKM